jgi:hypothetical protein
MKLRVNKSPYRTDEEQKQLYDKAQEQRKAKRKGEKILVAAPPGKSFHKYRLAVDLSVISPDEKSVIRNPSLLRLVWEEAQRLELGLEWGGLWEDDKNDPPHFQMSFGMSVEYYQAMYPGGNVPW